MSRTVIQRRKAVIYAQVSSKEQEKEGFSIPAQLKLLKKSLRTSADLRPVILVEKTDRLYRNLKDWVTVDELDLEIHFVKENVILSQNSRSSEKFMHGIKVLQLLLQTACLSHHPIIIAQRFLWQNVKRSV
jgi:site-specific DNA recombinase